MTTKPSPPFVPSRVQLRVSNPHAPHGSDHSRQDGQPASAAAGTKTMIFAQAIPLVAGKGMIP